MTSFNAFVVLMLAIGYGLSEQYGKHYWKVTALCALYFIFQAFPIYSSSHKFTDPEGKYMVFIRLYLVGIIATISFIPQSHSNNPLSYHIFLL